MIGVKKIPYLMLNEYYICFIRESPCFSKIKMRRKAIYGKFVIHKNCKHTHIRSTFKLVNSL